MKNVATKNRLLHPVDSILVENKIIEFVVSSDFSNDFINSLNNYFIFNKPSNLESIIKIIQCSFDMISIGEQEKFQKGFTLLHIILNHDSFRENSDLSMQIVNFSLSLAENESETIHTAGIKLLDKLATSRENCVYILSSLTLTRFQNALMQENLSPLCLEYGRLLATICKRICKEKECDQELMKVCFSSAKRLIEMFSHCNPDELDSNAKDIIKVGIDIIISLSGHMSWDYFFIRLHQSLVGLFTGFLMSIRSTSIRIKVLTCISMCIRSSYCQNIHIPFEKILYCFDHYRVDIQKAAVKCINELCLKLGSYSCINNDNLICYFGKFFSESNVKNRLLTLQTLKLFIDKLVGELEPLRLQLCSQNIFKSISDLILVCSKNDLMYILRIYEQLLNTCVKFNTIEEAIQDFHQNNIVEILIDAFSREQDKALMEYFGIIFKLLRVELF